MEYRRGAKFSHQAFGIGPNLQVADLGMLDAVVGENHVEIEREGEGTAIQHCRRCPTKSRFEPVTATSAQPSWQKSRER
jgi:hypothetical protein